MEKSLFRIALAGNPNSGKTSLFNALTGARQHVGNYAGATVEKKLGHYSDDAGVVEVLDLPGTYSLSPYSPEERIAREEILSGEYAVVVVVADSTNLRRNLYLLTQIMLAEVSVVLCLNMMDEAERSGQKLDLDQMERLLGFPVIQTAANRGLGTDSLKQAVRRAADKKPSRSRLVLGERLDRALDLLTPMIAAIPDAPAPRFLAEKILENDALAMAWLKKAHPVEASVIELRSRALARELEESARVDISTVIADRHYGFVVGLLREVVVQPAREDSRVYSDRIDHVLSHPWLGPGFFLVAMYVLFYLTFQLGEIPMSWIEAGFEFLGDWIGGFWPEGAESPLRSLLMDGIIGGVGGVVVFLPNILLLFLGLSFMEDTGYMARAAFLMDNLMHRFGLHGKSFIPLVTGFGCTVPGVMATRTLENERDRLTTMLVLPLISCGARLPIWLLLIPAFFAPAWRAPMLWLIYIIGIVLAVTLAKLLRVTLLRGEDAPFVMELPPYRLPTLKALLVKTLERGWLYLRKAGTIILGISILLWALCYFPRTEAAPNEASASAAAVQETQKNEDEDPDAAAQLEQSYAGRIGKAMEPLLAPMGLDWRIGTGLIGAFAAKEVFVSQMGIVFSLGEEGDEESLAQRLAGAYTPLAGFALMLFLLIATPCMATLAVVRRESGSTGWAALQFFGLTLFAWVLATLVYQVGRLFA